MGTFFHNMAKIKRHKNKISSILDELGNVVTDNNGISGCLFDFYSKHWISTHSTSVSDLANALPTDRNSFDDVEREWLARLMAVSEIFITLKSMPKVKSPGPNGLNLEFYLFY